MNPVAISVSPMGSIPILSWGRVWTKSKTVEKISRNFHQIT